MSNTDTKVLAAAARFFATDAELWAAPGDEIIEGDTTIDRLWDRWYQDLATVQALPANTRDGLIAKVRVAHRALECANGSGCDDDMSKEERMAMETLALVLERGVAP